MPSRPRGVSPKPHTQTESAFVVVGLFTLLIAYVTAIELPFSDLRGSWRMLVRSYEATSTLDRLVNRDTAQLRLDVRETELDRTLLAQQENDLAQAERPGADADAKRTNELRSAVEKTKGRIRKRDAEDLRLRAQIDRVKAFRGDNRQRKTSTLQMLRADKDIFLLGMSMKLPARSLAPVWLAAASIWVLYLASVRRRYVASWADPPADAAETPYWLAPLPWTRRSGPASYPAWKPPALALVLAGLAVVAARVGYVGIQGSRIYFDLFVATAFRPGQAHYYWSFLGLLLPVLAFAAFTAALCWLLWQSRPIGEDERREPEGARRALIAAGGAIVVVALPLSLAGYAFMRQSEARLRNVYCGLSKRFHKRRRVVFATRLGRGFYRHRTSGGIHYVESDGRVRTLNAPVAATRLAPIGLERVLKVELPLRMGATIRSLHSLAYAPQPLPAGFAHGVEGEILARLGKARWTPAAVREAWPLLSSAISALAGSAERKRGERLVFLAARLAARLGDAALLAETAALAERLTGCERVARQLPVWRAAALVAAGRRPVTEDERKAHSWLKSPRRRRAWVEPAPVRANPLLPAECRRPRRTVLA